MHRCIGTRTLDTVKDIQAQKLPVAPHFTCVSASRTQLVEQLRGYQTLGVRHIAHDFEEVAALLA